MAPESRINQLKSLELASANAKRAAVVALFYPDGLMQTNLLLILRHTYSGVHSNQVGLPGGKVEKTDIDLKYTALRETEEEVGVTPDRIDIIKPLTKLYIPPSNFEVQPYVGLSRQRERFVKQQSEVKELIEVPLKDFMDDKSLTKEVLQTSYARKMEVPAFKLRGYTVWGATAMMLSEIKDLFKQVL